jgi:uncharacterized protein YndB with AHSA1/START domain
MNAEAQNFAKAEMLIRKPVSLVFEAIIDPALTTKFWFTKSTGKLEENKHVEWTWEMYDYVAPVLVKSIVPDERIEIEWGNEDALTTVEWTFKPLSADSTFVSIVNTGFKGDVEQIIAQIRDSTEGFTLLLAALKAYLEHGIELNLIADRFPEGLENQTGLT